MDVIFYEAFEEETSLLRQLLPSSIEAGFIPQTIQASLDETPPSTLISIRTQSIIPLTWSSEIKGVLSRSAGFDRLTAYRQKAGKSVACGHLTNYCSRAVAEQAAMLTMSLFRKLQRQQDQLETFHRDGLTGIECRGRNALVIGVGNIGSEIVDIFQGLGMKIKGVDIVHRRNDVEYVSLDEGIAWAQAIVCALPLTGETKGLLSFDRLKKNKKKPVLINIARGEITPLEDIIRLMEGKILSGVALDVYPDEDTLAENLRALVSDDPAVQLLYRLKSLDNVICTPHNAFNSEEALFEKCRQTVTAVNMFIQEGAFPNTLI